MSDAVDLHVARLVDGALRYASYDRSDPFTTDRCMCHIRQVLCGAIQDTEGLPWYWHEGNHSQRTQIKGAVGGPGHYDALVVSTIDDGNVVLSHRDLRRP